MNEYALLISGAFVEIRRLKERPPHIPQKSVEWYPVLREYGAVHFEGMEGDNWVIREVDPALLPPAVPASITPRQCRLILSQQGLLESVEATIAASDEATRITWEYALEFRRDDPLLNQLAVGLNITQEQIDQFFIAAAQL